MSDGELSNEVAEELRLLGRRVAEEVLDEAESRSDGLADAKSARLTKGDIDSAWVYLDSVRPTRRVRVDKIIQFAVMALSLAAFFLLIYLLVANSLSRAESAALMVVVVGFFYTVVTVATSFRQRLSAARRDHAADKRGSTEVSAVGYSDLEVRQAEGSVHQDVRETRRWVEIEEKESEDEVPSTLIQFIDVVTRDPERTSRLTFIVWQLSLAAAVIAAVIAGFVYIGTREFASELQYVIAFGSATLFAITRLFLRRDHRVKARQKSKKRKG